VPPQADETTIEQGRAAVEASLRVLEARAKEMLV
jgi:hypothetical protein